VNIVHHSSNIFKRWPSGRKFIWKFCCFSFGRYPSYYGYEDSSSSAGGVLLPPVVWAGAPWGWTGWTVAAWLEEPGKITEKSPEKLKSKTRQQDHGVMENHQRIDDINIWLPNIYIYIYIYIHNIYIYEII